jgi:hypothetical protein
VVNRHFSLGAHILVHWTNSSKQQIRPFQILGIAVKKQSVEGRGSSLRWDSQQWALWGANICQGQQMVREQPTGDVRIEYINKSPGWD